MTPKNYGIEPITLRQIEDYTDEELIENFDSRLKGTFPQQLSSDLFLGEHRHRQHLRLSKEMNKNTKVVTSCTKWITGLTIAMFILAVLNFWIVLVGVGG